MNDSRSVADEHVRWAASQGFKPDEVLESLEIYWCSDKAAEWPDVQRHLETCWKELTSNG